MPYYLGCLAPKSRDFFHHGLGRLAPAVGQDAPLATISEITPHKRTLLVTLDLSKCFDVVPNNKLLEKLSLYGIDTSWFASYLSGHTQQVQISE